MDMNINEERKKLILIVNNNTIDYEFFKKNRLIKDETRINFLWSVLLLTFEYSEVEPYLKNLLNYYTVDELDKMLDSGWSILHHMAYYSKISLNAFEIMINYGININIKDKIYNDTVAHILLLNVSHNHINSILNLLIKYGINLNITNNAKRTVLDELVFCKKLDEETKNCVMLLIDFGAKNNCIDYIDDNATLDFIEYYKNLSIKPAIKNENKI